MLNFRFIQWITENKFGEVESVYEKYSQNYGDCFCSANNDSINYPRNYLDNKFIYVNDINGYSIEELKYIASNLNSNLEKLMLQTLGNFISTEDSNNIKQFNSENFKEELIETSPIQPNTNNESLKTFENSYYINSISNKNDIIIDDAMVKLIEKSKKINEYLSIKILATIPKREFIELLTSSFENEDMDKAYEYIVHNYIDKKELIDLIKISLKDYYNNNLTF